MNTARLFFTSDHHFGHTNILKYEARNRVDATGSTFTSADEMDQYLIQQWNDTVGSSDTVYVLGDFSLKRSYMADYLPRLNGKKHLIVGNHDPFFKKLVSGKQKDHAQAVEAAKALGWEDLWLNRSIEIDGVGSVLLSHFPYEVMISSETPDYELRYRDLQPKRNGPEAILLHGHVHGKWKVKREQGDGRDLMMINVGVDAWSMRPVSLDEIVEIANHGVKKI